MRIWRPTRPRRCGAAARSAAAASSATRSAIVRPPSPPASSSRPWRSARSRLTSTPVSVTSSRRGSDMRSSSSASTSSITSLTRRCAGYLRGATAHRIPLATLEPGRSRRRAARRRRAATTNRSTDASTSRSWRPLLADDRHPDRRPLPLVLVVDLGHRDLKRCRSPSTIGRIAARFAFSDRLSGTWRSKQAAAACTRALSRAAAIRRHSTSHRPCIANPPRQTRAISRSSNVSMMSPGLRSE